jgi:adenylate kinase family enzyme
MPVINYFKEKGVVEEINGDQSIEKVFEGILLKLPRG